jgi:3-isopropylmalate/(R)-2-methylmalate dehydratase small subunit
LFLRNCLHYGLPVIALPAARTLINECDVLDIDIEAGQVTNATTGQNHAFPVFPEFITQMLQSRGLINQLENGGYLRPRPEAK